MEMYATVVYVIAEEVLRIFKVNDDPQSRMSNAEIITFAIFTAKFFSGNFRMGRYILKDYPYSSILKTVSVTPLPVLNEVSVAICVLEVSGESGDFLERGK